MADDEISFIVQSPEHNANLYHHIPQLLLPAQPNFIPEGYNVPTGVIKVVDNASRTHFPWLKEEEVPPLAENSLPIHLSMLHPKYLCQKRLTTSDRSNLVLPAKAIRTALPRFFHPREVHQMHNRTEDGGLGVSVNVHIVRPNMDTTGNARLFFDLNYRCKLTSQWWRTQGEGFEAYLSDYVEDESRAKVRIWFYHQEQPGFIIHFE